MHFDRESILKALKAVKPALASRDQIEEFTCVWLDGNYMMGFNDVGLGIQIPFKSEFKGGLKGSLLIDIINVCKTKDIAIEETDKENTIALKAGKAKFTLAAHPLKAMLGEIPDLKKLQFVQLSKKSILAITKIITGVGNESDAMPEKRGITFIPGEDGTKLYATDGTTMTKVFIAEQVYPKRVTLPTSFIKQMLEIDQPQLAIARDVTAAKNEGRLTFSKLVDVTEPADIATIVNESLKGSTLIPIPARFKLALAKASVMLQKQKDKHYITLKIEGEVMHLRVIGSLGEFKDTVALEKKHPKIEGKYDPELIAKGLLYCSNMAFNERCLIMKGVNFLHMVAPYGS